MVYCLSNDASTNSNLKNAAKGESVALSGYHAPFRLQTTTSICVVSTLPTCDDYTAIQLSCVRTVGGWNCSFICRMPEGLMPSYSTMSRRKCAHQQMGHSPQWILSPSKWSWLKVLWGGGWTVKLLGSRRWWNTYLCTSKEALAHDVLTVLCHPKHDEQDINA
jgi:hypothetical protein